MPVALSLRPQLSCAVPQPFPALGLRTSGIGEYAESRHMNTSLDLLKLKFFQLLQLFESVSFVRLLGGLQHFQHLHASCTNKSMRSEHLHSIRICTWLPAGAAFPLLCERDKRTHPPVVAPVQILTRISTLASGPAVRALAHERGPAIKYQYHILLCRRSK